MRQVSIPLRRRLITKQEPSETANNVALAGRYPSRWNVGDVVSFQPDVRKIDENTDSAFNGTKARVSAIGFSFNKVLYELEVYDGENGWYTNYPIRSVDSYFVRPWPIEEEHL